MITTNKLLESFKITLQQSSNYVSTFKEAIQKYDQILANYSSMIKLEFADIKLSEEKLNRLYSYGIANCLAICELDIRQMEGVNND